MGREFAFVLFDVRLMKMCGGNREHAKAQTRRLRLFAFCTHDFVVTIGMDSWEYLRKKYGVTTTTPMSHTNTWPAFLCLFSLDD